MEDMPVTLGVYFEIKDADLYGGKGTVGYANINIDVKISRLVCEDVCNAVKQQRKGIAEMCHVDIEKVRVISRTEYEEQTEEEDA